MSRQTIPSPRFKMAREERLTYDENSISALAPIRSENIIQKRQSGVLTINEIRTLYGYEAIEGGDQLYQPFNLVAIGTDQHTGDNITKPAPRKQLTAQEMYELLKRQLDPDGKPRFNDVQLRKYAGIGA